jgi:large subunit ribosomal protein L14e
VLFYGGFAGTIAKFASSSWGQKIAIQKARKSLTDFDRFKVMVARVKKSAIMKREVAKARK